MADINMKAQISVEFEETTSRQSLNSGETINTLWSKVKRWLSDLKTVCFSGSYNDLSDKPTIPTVGNGTVTIKQGGTNKGSFTMNQSGNTTIELTDNDTTYSPATQSTNGLMSAEDKVKLDGIDVNANYTVVDSELSDTSTNPVQNKIINTALNNKADKSKYSDTTINVGRKADTTVGVYSTAEGFNTTANGDYSHAEGINTAAIGQGSHAEGSNLEQDNYGNINFENPREVQIDDTTTITVEGSQAFGLNSHAEGCSTLAYGKNSHTEGYHTVAKSNESHAEGCESEASGAFAHAEGYRTNASGDYSHAEGFDTTASGNSSHSEGFLTTASGNYSHAGGKSTQALHNYEVAYGNYNQSNDDTLFSIGDGTDGSARHNAFEITVTGGKLHDKDIATTDLIPTELPANGGNADTVGGLSTSSFVQNFSNWNSGDVTDLALASKSGYAFINNGVTDMPFNNGYWFGNIHASSNHRHIVVSDIAGNKTYVRSYNASTGNWTEWKNISEIQNTCVTGSTTNVDVTLGFRPSAVIIVDSSGVVYLPSEITATGFKCKYLAEGTSRVYWAFR